MGRDPDSTDLVIHALVTDKGMTATVGVLETDIQRRKGRVKSGNVNAAVRKNHAMLHRVQCHGAVQCP